MFILPKAGQILPYLFPGSRSRFRWTPDRPGLLGESGQEKLRAQAEQHDEHLQLARQERGRFEAQQVNMDLS